MAKTAKLESATSSRRERAPQRGPASLLAVAFVAPALAEDADYADVKTLAGKPSVSSWAGMYMGVMDWYALKEGKSVWRRAAGVYIRILSEPQLFIEGNHRTGALIMSYLLAREGRAPFVLTDDNAREYFNPRSRNPRNTASSCGSSCPG
jgi:hypothetical protein